jgi:hypothetical protein
MAIICIHCSNPNPNSSNFCNQCGAKLVQVENAGAGNIQQTTEYLGNIKPPPVKPVEVKIRGLALYVLDAKSAIPLELKERTTLGRSIEGASVLPDIDFDQYEGFVLGVSRMHAVIHNNEEGIFISDLQSSNGTFVNRSRLKPYEMVAIKHGDIISLGMLRTQFIKYIND